MFADLGQHKYVEYVELDCSWSNLDELQYYGCPFFVDPMVIWGSLNSSIFLVIYFANQYCTMLGYK